MNATRDELLRIAESLESRGFDSGEDRDHAMEHAEMIRTLAAQIDAPTYACDYCGKEYTDARICCEARRQYLTPKDALSAREMSELDRDENDPSADDMLATMKRPPVTWTLPVEDLAGTVLKDAPSQKAERACHGSRCGARTGLMP